MALSQDIHLLRDRVLTELNAAHDYYTDTQFAWEIVLEVIAGGRAFSVRNMLTHSVTTQADLAGRAGLHGRATCRGDLPAIYRNL